MIQRGSSGRTSRRSQGSGCLSITVGALTAHGPPRAEKEHEGGEARGLFPPGLGWIEQISECRKDQRGASLPPENIHPPRSINRHSLGERPN